MRTKAPPLLPLFRSESQARLLTELYLHAPAEGLGLSELAARAGVSVGTAHRELNRLEEAGLVHSVRLRRERLFRANEDSPYHSDLRALLLKAFGPVSVLRPILSGIEGVRFAYVFGSWARRYSGEPGRAPFDLDVLVIGDPRPDEVYSACRRAETELGVEVNPTILSEAEWREKESGFLRHLHRGPLVPILDGAQ